MPWAPEPLRTGAGIRRMPVSRYNKPLPPMPSYASPFHEMLANIPPNQNAMGESALLWLPIH